MLAYYFHMKWGPTDLTNPTNHPTHLHIIRKSIRQRQRHNVLNGAAAAADVECYRYHIESHHITSHRFAHNVYYHETTCISIKSKRFQNAWAINSEWENINPLTELNFVETTRAFVHYSQAKGCFFIRIQCLSKSDEWHTITTNYCLINNFQFSSKENEEEDEKMKNRSHRVLIRIAVWNRNWTSH